VLLSRAVRKTSGKKLTARFPFTRPLPFQCVPSSPPTSTPLDWLWCTCSLYSVFLYCELREDPADPFLREFDGGGAGDFQAAAMAALDQIGPAVPSRPSTGAATNSVPVWLAGGNLLCALLFR